MNFWCSVKPSGGSVASTDDSHRLHFRTPQLTSSLRYLSLRTTSVNASRLCETREHTFDDLSSNSLLEKLLLGNRRIFTRTFSNSNLHHSLTCRFQAQRGEWIGDGWSKIRVDFSTVCARRSVRSRSGSRQGKTDRRMGCDCCF